MSEKYGAEIENCIRRNIAWNELPIHLHELLHHNQRDYEKYVFNYSLKNQLRFRGSLVSKLFRNEQRYYELLIQKNIYCLGLFPYHLADVVTRGLRVTPFNYYVDVLSQLLINDKSYDTLPNFTAADCLRVLGIGRNEYLALVSEMKTRSMKDLIFNTKLNPIDILPRFPANICIEPWWLVQIAYVLDSDIRYINDEERSLLDNLIDYGPIEAGKCRYNLIQNLYRKGFIYMDVPIVGKERISIPPLRNFVMNRVCGDYFENLLYKIFISVDEHMTVEELSQMLQVDFDIVKHAVSLFCRLGFAQRKAKYAEEISDYDGSWLKIINDRAQAQQPLMPITPLTYDKTVLRDTKLHNNGSLNFEAQSQQQQQQEKDNCSVSNTSSSDGNHSDYSFANINSFSNISSNSLATQDHSSEMINVTEHDLSSELEEISETITPKKSLHLNIGRSSKRVAFLFDSTLAAFLMMGNLSPGLKNHAVTMFEVGKLCDESMNTFLAELEKVSLMDAEGEGDVSRYFTHAVILRSTICSLRHVLPSGLDLLRLECLEGLDVQTRDRILEKKYKFLISCTPLAAKLTHLFKIPFFGQYFPSSDCSHMWTKIFYYHITGYGPPSLYLARGTVLKALPRIFLGYGKLLINIQHSDAFIISSENYRCLNDQLQNGCVLIQGYGIRSPGELHYMSFPYDKNDKYMAQWVQHHAVERLAQVLDLKHHCGYITFLNTGVPDMGSKTYNAPVELIRYMRKTSSSYNKLRKQSIDKSAKCIPSNETNNSKTITTSSDIPIDFTFTTPLEDEISNFTLINRFAAVQLQEENKTDNSLLHDALKNVHQDHFAISPQRICTEMLCSDKEEEETLIENWTLLDVNFGVPLFDMACNTYICEQISKKLSNNEHVSQLPERAQAMHCSFLTFVKQCLYFVDEPNTGSNFDMEDILPQPRINLVFENGHIFHWSGK